MMHKVCILSSVHDALDNRVFYREARSLKKAEYEVTIIAIHPVTEVREGIKIIGLPKVPRWQRPMIWGNLFQLAIAESADIYHFHDPELLLITPMLRILTRKPTIYDIHEVYADFIKIKDYIPSWLRYPIAWIFRWLEPILSCFQSALIFSDDEIGNSFKWLQIPKTTLFNFPGKFFVEAGVASSKDDMPRPPIVLHLGSLERNRGTYLLIEAFTLVLTNFPDAKLLLVGSYTPPDLEEEVRNHVNENRIAESVSILGQVPFRTIGEYLKQAAVGWVPWQPYSKNEKNIPTKLFEYMSYAIPIVSSDLTSTRLFVTNRENGYLVKATDPVAHAQAILDILHNPIHGLSMGRRGQELTRTKYNWDSEEKKLLALYESLLH
jgi:glycosyltransferase involved in cell wall biosynthesis